MIPVNGSDEQRLLLKLRRDGRMDKPRPDSSEASILARLVDKGHVYDNGNGVFLPVQRTLVVEGRDFHLEVADYLYVLHLDHGLLIARRYDTKFYPWAEIHHWEAIDTAPYH